MRQWITYLTLLFITVPVTAQIFAPIDQTYSFKKRTELGRKLSVARPDSNKVLLLLDIGNAYLKSNAPDSALFFSGKAVDLALRLRRYVEEQQGLFLIVRADAMKGDIASAEAVTSRATGIWKMRMLQELSEHYSFRPGTLPSNLDTAWRYIRQLMALTDTMHSMTAVQNTRAVLGKYYYARGETKKGVDYFRQNILEWQLAGNKEQEAHWWSELGLYTPGTPDNTPIILEAHIHALRLYETIGMQHEALYTLMDLAEFHWVLGNLALAEREQQQVITGLKKIGQARMFNVYRKTASTELSLGNPERAMRLILLAKRNMDSLEQDDVAGQLDKHLGDIYWADNQLEKSLDSYQKALSEVQGRRDLEVYGPALRIVQLLALMNKGIQARKFLTRFEKETPPVRNRDKEYLAMAWGNVYESLGLPDVAEQHFLRMIGYHILAREDDRKEIEWMHDVMRPESYYDIGRFYLKQGQYAKAKTYLLEQLKPEFGVPQFPYIAKNAYFLLYKVDSALGNWIPAMRSRLRYERYSDSIQSEQKEKEIAEVQIQYESDKKDRDISLLSQQAHLQQDDLSRSAMIRNIILGGLGLTLIIIGLLYNQYRLKQKNNTVLQLLLGEKEILLREIHHRVKNNLQTIVSLLGSQSAYLSNEALEAIRDSQNRVYSISLIHQKLYQGENVAVISMDSYLPELIGYLRDIYGIRNQPAFQLDIVALELDISQAVSIGLILNEAITNAIKHAFPAKGKGNCINIKMVQGDKNIIRLTIADNGVGIPAGRNPGGRHSLGMKLMKGLTDDLGGIFAIESLSGTVVSVRFVANTSLENAIRIISSEETLQV